MRRRHEQKLGGRRVRRTSEAERKGGLLLYCSLEASCTQREAVEAGLELVGLEARLGMFP